MELKSDWVGQWGEGGLNHLFVTRADAAHKYMFGPHGGPLSFNYHSETHKITKSVKNAKGSVVIRKQ